MLGVSRLICGFVPFIDGWFTTGFGKKKNVPQIFLFL